MFNLCEWVNNGNELFGGSLVMESIVQEIANVGITIMCVVVGIVIVRWLDNNIFNNRGN